MRGVGFAARRRLIEPRVFFGWQRAYVELDADEESILLDLCVRGDGSVHTVVLAGDVGPKVYALSLDVEADA